MKKILMFSFALSLISTAKALALGYPPPDQIGIAEVNYRGTGCPTGSVASNVASDGQAMTLVFSQFGVDTSVRGGWPMRKGCNIELTLRRQPGWQYSLIGVDIRGYANLQAGAVGVQKVAYSFGRMTKRAVDRLRIVGPFDDNFANHSDIGLGDGEWSPCGQDAQVSRLLLRVAVNVRPQRGFTDDDGDSDNGRRGTAAGMVLPSGYMAVDAVDGGIVHRYQLAWRRCR
ncbi:MAG: hypothetical protein RL011_1622 [Pseudomonadota bacterium]